MNCIHFTMMSVLDLCLAQPRTTCFSSLVSFMVMVMTMMVIVMVDDDKGNHGYNGEGDVIMAMVIKLIM